MVPWQWHVAMPNVLQLITAYNEDNSERSVLEKCKLYSNVQ